MTRVICISAVVALLVPVVVAQQPKVDVKPLKLLEVRERDMAPKPKGDDGKMEFTFGPNRAGLTLTLQLSGEAAKSATHYGHFKLAVKDDKGQDLKLDTENMFNDPVKEFVEIDRNQMSFGMDELPADELRIDVPLMLPARAATKIDVKGEISLQVADTVDVLIPDVLNVKGAVKNKQFADIGVTLTIKEPKTEGWMGESSFGVVCEVKGDPTRVLRMELVDANGETVKGNGSERSGSDDDIEHVLWFEEKPAAGAKLKVVVAAKQMTLKVPVELKGLELP